MGSATGASMSTRVGSSGLPVCVGQQPADASSGGGGPPGSGRLVRCRSASLSGKRQVAGDQLFRRQRHPARL